MKKLILAVLLLMLSTPVWAAPDADHDADRAAAAFSVVTPATDDYWILTDTSNSGRFAKVATSSVRAALGIGTSDNPTWNSGNFTGGNIAASNTQVTKKWITGLQYTANVTSVIHGGRHYICTSTHTASAAGTGAGTNEPGVGDDWATVWTLGVLGDNTIYTQDTEPAGGTDGDIWVDTNGTSGSRLYTYEDSAWVAQAGGGGGYTTFGQFDGETPWRVYYSNTDGDITELALGADGTYLKSNGASAAPTWATPAGSGDMVLATAQSVTGAKTFDPSMLLMKGTSTGVTTFATANTSASNYTATFQAATGTVAYTADVPTAGSLSVDDLITLSGVATGAVNLGSFTGATVDDNLTVKAALQDMETSFEAKLPTGADGEYGAWLTNNTVNPNTYSTGKTGFAYYNNSPVWCYNGTCRGVGSGDVITGYSSGAGAVAATDTVVQAINKLNGNTAAKQDGDADLTTWAGVTPTANGQSLVSSTNYASMRGLLDLEAGTDFSALGSTVVTTTSKSGAYTIGTDAASESYGATVYVTSAATITAAAVATGQNFTVVTIGDIAVSLDVNASDRMILDGVTLSDGDKATNSSKAGDTITCQYYSADGFYCWSGTVLGGHWTDTN